MTVETFDQTLRLFQERVPYRPFTVVLHSGKQFEIDHARALVFRDGVALFAGPGGVPYIFDHEGVEHFVGDLAEKAEL
jgi:hypothetical protein